jgi:hypothetical protein
VVLKKHRRLTRTKRALALVALMALVVTLAVVSGRKQIRPRELCATRDRIDGLGSARFNFPCESSSTMKVASHGQCKTKQRGNRIVVTLDAPTEARDRLGGVWDLLRRGPHDSMVTHDCAIGRMTCPLPPVPDGLWTVVFEDRSFPLEVAGGRFPETCVRLP